jgi:hypothetical protein
VIKILFLFGSVALLHAQPVSLSYGAKLGVPLNDPVQSDPFTTSSPGRWTGGPFVEVHLPLRLSVEFSALYRSSTENAARIFPLGTTVNPYLFSSKDEVKTWDFPLLLKYRFTKGKFQPFIGAGGAWSHRRSDFQSFASCLGPEGSCRPPDSPFGFVGGFRKSTLTKFGPAASAGFDIRTKHVTISPEARWNRVFSGSGPREQFSVMVGFGFGR